jgi:hypothetical protein
MAVDHIDSDFEASFLKQRLADLHGTHPAEAALTANVLAALDYQKTAVRNELQVRGMVIALGYTLAQQPAHGLSGFSGWLGQFVKDGALSAKQAATFKAQAEAIQP